MASPKRLIVVCASLALAIALLNLIPEILHLIDGIIDSDYHDVVDTSLLRRRSMLALHLPSFGSSSRVEDDAKTNYEYSVLLVSYHKTGHDLQMDLVDFITKEFPNSGPKLTAYGNTSPVRRRRHTPGKIPCARLYVQTGAIMVQHAPDFFCSPEQLSNILLEGGGGHGNNGTLLDRGVKIVHLVRNPFAMAVSNYHYHARVPTPEPWIKLQDPCDTDYKFTKAGKVDPSIPIVKYRDLVMPTLSKMSYASNEIAFGGKQLMTRDEFEAVRRDCVSLWRTTPELKNANQLEHLMNYDAPEGLRLATAEMMIQGYDNGGDILRMANNIVRLKQTQVYVQNYNDYFGQYQETTLKELQIYTLSLDDFIANPRASALKFFDFVLAGPNTTSAVSQAQKEAVATKYEQYYSEKIKKSRHVTNGKSENTEQLKEYLRHEPVFGPPLSKIEMLVEAALKESQAE